MRKLNVVSAVLFVTALGVSSASAQSCLGLPSFSNTAFRLNASAEFADGAQAYMGGLGAGKANSVFGTVGGGIATYDNVDERSSIGFVELGWQAPLGKAHLCPVAGASIVSGPNTTDFEVSSRGFSGGLAIGLPVELTGLTLMPNVAARYLVQTDKIDEPIFGESEETFKTGLLDLGVAFLFGQRYSIQPLVHVPFGGDDDEVTAGIFFSIGFGPR